MTDQRSFDLLQNRWVSGDVLSSEDEQARLQHAAVDPLAARELEVFAELERHLATPDEDVPNVAAALARARGVKLRVVTPRESALGGERARFGRGALVAGVAAGLSLAAAATLLLTRHTATPRAAVTTAGKPALASPVVEAQVVRSELVFVSGDVSIGGKRAGVGGPTLLVGARVATRDGSACLNVDPGIDVCLGPKSEVSLESLTPADVRVRVSAGTAVASLSPRSAGHTFSLVTGDVAATAHGTVFALDAGGREPVRVTVLEGSVAVAAAGEKSRLIDAHSSLSLAKGSAPKLETAGRGEEARLLAWLAPKDLAHGKSVGVLEIQEQGTLRALVDDQGPYGLPLSAFVSAGRHRVALRPAVGADDVLDADVEAGGVRRVTRESARPGDESAPSARALLDQARERLTRKDTRGARALYERLRQMHPTSPEAHTVLVSLAKLELDGGSPERALTLFDAYAKGGGPLLPEALSGRIRALRALGRTLDERRAIEGYLASYPKSFEAPALEKRLGSIAGP